MWDQTFYEQFPWPRVITAPFCGLTGTRDENCALLKFLLREGKDLREKIPDSPEAPLLS